MYYNDNDNYNHSGRNDGYNYSRETPRGNNNQSGRANGYSRPQSNQYGGYDSRGYRQQNSENGAPDGYRGSGSPGTGRAPYAAGQTGQRRPTGTRQPVRRRPRFTPIGFIKHRILPCLLVVLIVFLAGKAIKSNGSKITVYADKVTTGAINSVRTVKGYLTQDENSNSYKIRFIDNDYIEHGIKQNTMASIADPRNPGDVITCTFVDQKNISLDSEEYDELIGVLGEDGTGAPAVNSAPSDGNDDTEGTDNGNYSGNDGYDSNENGYDSESGYDDTGDEYQGDGSSEYNVNGACEIIFSVIWSGTSSDVAGAFPISPNTVIDIDLCIDQVAAAKRVPTEAVFEKDGKSHIAIISKHKTLVCEITKGIEGNGLTQLINSEIADDTVVITALSDGSPLSSIESGCKVKVTTPDSEK